MEPIGKDFYVYGKIDIEMSRSFKQWSKEVATENEVDIYFNSSGGSIQAILSIATAMMQLRQNGVTLTTHCDAEAFSGAALLFLMGDNGHRFMSQYGSLMIHSISCESSGTIRESRGYMNNLDSCYAELLDDAKTGLHNLFSVYTEEPISLIKDGLDHYFTFEECEEYGWVENSIPDTKTLGHSGRKYVTYKLKGGGSIGSK